METDKKPAILLLGSQMARAGAQEVLLTQARWFQQQGYPVTAAFFYDRDGLAATWQAREPFPVINLNAWGYRIPLRRKLPRLGPGLLRLWRILRIEKIQIIETFTPDSNLMGLPLAWLAGVRARVATHHGYIEGTGKLERWLHGRLVNSGIARRLVAVSAQVAEQAVNEEGVRKARVRVIENGIQPLPPSTPAARAELRQELGIAEKELLVLTVARFKIQKGYTYLMDAIPQAMTACPQAVFAFAGDGPLRAEMQVKAKTLGIEQNVRFLGVREDVPALLGAADVYVMPSLWEGLPIALLEAMSLGLPCVVTAVEGVRDILRDGENGRLVAPEDAAGLAKAMVETLNDPTGRARMGAAAQALFAQKYTVARMCGEYEAVFDELLDGKRQ
ncbi:MAG: glycosyltransferase [Anaerolineae bacterium]|nr:MAG: glycosyltransferase [Anaerolineae bacterium]